MAIPCDEGPMNAEEGENTIELASKTAIHPTK
jgi:hypothetical protein